jgi:hypothetical protein
MEQTMNERIAHPQAALIERVARALAKARGLNPDEKISGDLQDAWDPHDGPPPRRGSVSFDVMTQEPRWMYFTEKALEHVVAASVIGARRI